MNKQQKQEIIDIIKKDAEITEYYYRHGETCVIGGLALACGVPIETLINACSAFIHTKDDTTANPNGAAAAVEAIRAGLAKRYGLTEDEMRELQQVNDWHDDREERQQRLIDKVEEFWKRYE